MANIRTSESGQIGLITLLIMTVMLSVGVSVVNRTTQDLKISRQEDEASQVFNAAEAGIERGLSEIEACATGTCTGSFSYAGVADQIPMNVEYEIEAMHTFEGVVTENTVVEIAIDDSALPGPTGNLRVMWGRNEGCNEGAGSLEVIVYNENNTVWRDGFRPPGLACDKGDNFISAVDSRVLSDFYQRVDVPLKTGDKLVRIKALYNDTEVFVDGDGWVLPVVAYRVSSYASSDVGDENKLVQVYRGLPAAPAIFDYVLYSGGALNK